MRATAAGAAARQHVRVIPEGLMPIYEYRCTQCGQKFSRLQSVGAGVEGVRCPKCDSEQVERLLSSFASSSSTGSAASGGGHSCPSGFS